MNAQWWKDIVVYQIYPRSFNDSNGDGIGDIQGIIQKLDYLQELGVGMLWLSPIYHSPNDDNGYDISNYFEIQPEYGTMADFECLLEETEKRNMHLMMDMVLNHTSDEHAWFQDAKNNPESPYRDYYFFRDGQEDQEPNDWASEFSPSAWERESPKGQYYLHLFSKKQPDINWSNPRVRQELYRVVEFWLTKGVDGLRFDVINYISKVEGLPSVNTAQPGYKYAGSFFTNGPHVHEYLQEMNKEVLSRFDVVTVGETPRVNDQQALMYTAQNEKEMDMIFQFEHVRLDAIGDDKWATVSWSLPALRESMSRWQVTLESKGWNSLYLNNHDQPRSVSRFGNDSDEYRERSAKMLATMIHMLKGTPFVYQGEELGMTNANFCDILSYRDLDTINYYNQSLLKLGKTAEPDVMANIMKKSRDNSRTPIQWDTSPNAGFTTGKPWIAVNDNYICINAQENLSRSDSVFHYYQKLIQLRKTHPIIVHGVFHLLLDDHPTIFAFRRSWRNHDLFVMLNFSQKTQEVQFDNDADVVSESLLIANYKNAETLNETLRLRPYEARVYIVTNNHTAEVNLNEC